MKRMVNLLDLLKHLRNLRLERWNSSVAVSHTVSKSTPK